MKVFLIVFLLIIIGAAREEYLTFKEIHEFCSDEEFPRICERKIKGDGCYGGLYND